LEEAIGLLRDRQILDLEYDVAKCLWVTAGSCLFSGVLQFLQALWVIQIFFDKSPQKEIWWYEVWSCQRLCLTMQSCICDEHDEMISLLRQLSRRFVY
jgi:hypothetical protein